MKKTLDILLFRAGVNQCYAGYPFFVEAVYMALEDPARLSSIQKSIYLPITLRHNITMFQLEKDLRTIRDVIMRNGGYELLENLSGCQFRRKNPPYPKEIIGIFADCLRES
ncbi:MAG: hypothetical protein HFI63_07710 [Lachnospiraceae bacterium]|nr:hypothetical protein [Lachnospiraceae bacterium]